MSELPSNAVPMSFDGYTDENGTCISPALIAELFQQAGQSLQQAQCAQRVADRVFLLTKLAEQTNFINQAVGQDDFAQEVQALQALIESLKDEDGDGLNDLQQIKSRLDTLENNYRSMSSTLAQHGQQITNLQTAQTTIQATQSTQGQQITSLQDALDNLDIDDNVRCEIVTDIYNAASAGMAAFTAALSVDCVLPTTMAEVEAMNSSEDTGGGADIPNEFGGNDDDGEDTPDDIGGGDDEGLDTL